MERDCVIMREKLSLRNLFSEWVPRGSKTQPKVNGSKSLEFGIVSTKLNGFLFALYVTMDET